MENTFRFIPVILLVILSGCAVSDDPRQGGLMGYWHGTSSGKYQERQQQKLEQLEEQKRTQQQLSKQAEQLEAEVAIQDLKLREEQKQVLKLEEELKILDTKLDKLQIKSEEQGQQLSTLRTQIQKTKQRIETQKATIVKLDNTGGNSADPDKLMILKHERDRLADEYRKLNRYYQALSGTIY